MKLLVTLLRSRTVSRRSLLILGIIFFCSFFGFSLFEKKQSADQVILGTFRLWEDDLALAISNSDLRFIEKFSKNIFQPLSFIAVGESTRVLYSLPFEQGEPSCLLPFNMPVTRYGTPVGWVKACVSAKKILQAACFSPVILLLFVLMAGVAVLSAMMPLLGYRRSLLRVISELEHWSANANESADQFASKNGALTDELERKLLGLVQQGVSARIETGKLQALAQQASQVSHDIKSPLATLDLLVAELKNLPEDQRVMTRAAVNRIKDIAHSLSSKNKAIKHGNDASAGNEPCSVQLLSSIIDPLISEKRVQFREKLGIDIDAKIDETSYGLFAKVQPAEFKRALSNLINNAVEAVSESGKVTLLLNKTQEQIEITISDNGAGIPPEILVRLGARGETHGKAGGSGLGLYHARTAFESWGGSLVIQSEVGKGSVIRLRLPASAPPSWFVSELKLTPNSHIVILDDDNSIHGIWEGRFGAMGVTQKGIQVVHLSNPNDFRRWIVDNQTASKEALFLVDYELLGFKESGLDLIRNFNLGSQSILVSSRFEEPQVRDACERLGVRLIPKGMAGFVPLAFQAELEKYDYILLDDDDLVKMTWKHAAGKRNLLFFSRPDDLINYLPRLQKSCPIHIDSGLGNGIKGEDVAKKS